MANTDEIVVRFRTEGGGSVEEAFRRVGTAADKVGGSTDRAGKSLDGLRLKSDDRVARNIGAIAQSFASGGSAADIFAASVTRLGESFKGGLLFGGAAAAGLGLYEAITRIGEAVIKFRTDVALLTRPSGNADFLGTDQINKRLSDTTAKIQEINQLQRESDRNLEGIGRAFFGSPFTGGGVFAKIDEERQTAKAALTRESARLIDDLTKKTQDLNRVESSRMNISEEQADLDRAEIEHKERLGALARAATDAGIAGSAAAQRSLDAENQRYALLVSLLEKATGLRQEEARAKHEADVGQFDRDVGSGAFLQQLAQQRLIDQQIQRGKQIIGELRAFDEANPGRLGPNERAILNRASELDSERPDFSGIASLAGLQFDGLRALDGLSLSIK